jgi:hypothetical protein
MTAVAWTAIGLLAATIFGSLYYLGGKIDSLGARLDARIDTLEGRIDSLGARLDARLDALAGRLDAHLQRHTG